MRGNDCCIILKVHKIDGDTGELLSGAVFDLHKEGCPTVRGVTNSRGTIQFRVRVCSTLTLREVLPPVGYIPNNRTYNIFIDECGCIFLNGRCARRIIISNTAEFTGEEPLMFAVFDNDTEIIGSGEPGCDIILTFPSGQNAVAVVDAEGSWIIPVLEPLTAGDTLYALQTCNSMRPSETVEVTVLSGTEFPDEEEIEGEIL